MSNHSDSLWKLGRPQGWWRLMDRKKRIDDNGLEVSMLPQSTTSREVEYMIGKIKSSSESGVFEINISKVEYFQVWLWVDEVRPHVS